MNNTLYFGDNLDILREHIAGESIDLIYLDPPFNSKRDDNLLFKTPKGHASEAQITALKIRGIGVSKPSTSSRRFCTRPTPTLPR